MRYINPRVSLLLAVTTSLLASCKPSGQEPSAKSKTTVFTVNYPLKYFAERIGGDLVHVEFPAPADEDPAFWKPEGDAVANYQGADVILLNGAKYAKWVRKATLPEAKLVDTTAAVKDQYIEVAGATHGHGPEGQHSHKGTAFTTWLDPKIAIAQASAVNDALKKLKPEQSEAFDKRFDALERDLTEIDQQLESILTEHSDLPLIASHPVYQYLGKRYKLNLKSVHWEPDSLPDDKAWDELAELRAEHPAKFLLWEGAPLQESIDKLNELGVQSIIFDPCGNTPEEGDYLTVMRANIANLQAITPN